MRLRLLVLGSLWACATEEPRVEDLPEVAHAARAAPSLAVPPWESAAFHRGPSDGDALVAWRPLGDELPRNRHFELEVWVVRAGVPVRGAELTVRAAMPEHGHGMNVEPRAYPQPDGSYRVRGMLLHMGGRWELTIHVLEPGRFHHATFELGVG